MSMRRTARTTGSSLATALAVGAILVPTAASGHVTVNPAQAPAGSYAAVAVRVPTESASQSTTKVVLKFPPGFLSTSFESKPGWKTVVVKRKLGKPVETMDGPVDEEVDQVVWTATDGGIPPGQFASFPLTLLVPQEAGKTVAFKALQTYSDGKIVRWIGPADAEEPAAQFTITQATGGHGAGHAGDVSDGSDSHVETVLVILALVVGLLALVLAVTALVRVRRLDA